MLNWLNSNSGAIGALSSVLLTVITIVYVYLTGRLAKESQEARLAMLRPELAVYLAPYEGSPLFILLCIENIGSGPAYRLRLGLDSPFKREDGVDIREIGMFSRGLNYLAPRQKIEHFLVSAADKADQLTNIRLKVLTEYEDSLHKSYRREFALDFGEILQNISRLGTPPLYGIADAAKKIQEDLHRLATDLHKPQVLTKPLADYQHGLKADLLAARLERLTREQLEEIQSLIVEKEQSNGGGQPASKESREGKPHNPAAPADQKAPLSDR